MSRDFSVALVGATGAVGRKIIECIEKRDFPASGIALYASSASEGKVLHVKGKPCRLAGLDPDRIGAFDLAFFAAPRGVSREFAPLFARAGAAVVDTSADWGLEGGTPLVVPEVNPRGIRGRRGILSCPSGAAVPLAVALKPLHDGAGVRRATVCASLAVSSGGRAALAEFESRLRIAAAAPAPDWGGELSISPATPDESRVAEEVRKILGDPSVRVAAWCRRVPVVQGTEEIITVETEKSLSAPEALDLLRKAPGVRPWDGPGEYPPHAQVIGSGEVWVGPVRADATAPRSLVLRAACDNLLKGSALNAVQVAELVLGI